MQQHGNKHTCGVLCALCIGQCACIVHLPFVYMAEPYIVWAFADDWNVGVAMAAKHRTTDIDRGSVMKCKHTKSKQQLSSCTCVTCNLGKLHIQS
jgi:hypothetical protein